MGEEERAAAFRAEQSARVAARCAARYSGLPGDPEAAQVLRDAWAPTIGPFWWDIPDCEDEPERVMTPVGPVARAAGRQLP